MRKFTLKSKTINPGDLNKNREQLQPVHLSSIIERMKQKKSWIEGELNTVVLMKSPEKQIILTALHGGTIIDSFQENNSITLEIIEGKLKFYAGKDTVTLSKGQILTLHENIKYNLFTSEDTVFLLTIESGVLQEA